MSPDEWEHGDHPRSEFVADAVKRITAPIPVQSKRPSWWRRFWDKHVPLMPGEYGRLDRKDGLS